jgi:hypothetical protein
MTETMEDQSTHLRQAWRDLNAEQQAWRQEIAVDHDTSRAELLARFHAAGLSHRAITACIDSLKAHVTRLLRYYRYRAQVSPNGTQIPEHQFRHYWLQVRDPGARQGRRGFDADYEREVFSTIAGGVRGPLASPSSMAARKVSASSWPMSQAVISASSRRSNASIATAPISSVRRRSSNGFNATECIWPKWWRSIAPSGTLRMENQPGRMP